MPSKTNLKLRRTLGIIMLAIGTVVLVRLYVLGHEPRIGSKAVDTIFGVFLVLRGGLSLRYGQENRNTPSA